MFCIQILFLSCVEEGATVGVGEGGVGLDFLILVILHLYLKCWKTELFRASFSKQQKYLACSIVGRQHAGFLLLKRVVSSSFVLYMHHESFTDLKALQVCE